MRKKAGRSRRGRFALAAAAAAVSVVSMGFFAAAEDEVFFDDNWDVQIEEDYGGDAATVPEAGGQNAFVEGSSADAGAEDELVIEDSSSVTVQEGAVLDDVLEAEAQAEAAARAVQDLLDREPLQLPSADASRLAEYLKNLLAEPSPTGSDGELIIGRYISSVMEELGYTTTEQSFHEGFLNDQLVDVPGVNLIAERGADSENRTDQIIMLCAHYDLKTGADADSKEPLDNDKTGVAVLMECARLLADVPSDVDLCFVFLSGEEDGNFGSLRFVEQLDEDVKSSIRAVLCVGPVGYKRMDEGAPLILPYHLGTGSGLASEPADLLRSLALYRAADEMLFQVADEAENTGLENTAETNTGTGSTAEETTGTENTGSEDGSAETAEPEGNWGIFKEEAGMGHAFEEAGFPTVLIYQAFPEEASEASKTPEEQDAQDTAEDLSMTEEKPAAEEASVAEAPQDMTEGAGAPQDENKTIWLDVPELTKTADLLAQAMGLYMQQPPQQ